MTPPSPSIGSSRMSPTSPSTAARSASTSFGWTKRTPGRSGSNGARLAGCPVAESAPERAPVEATLQGDDARLPGRLACVLQRRLDGLRARVAEERLRSAEAGGELRGEPLRGLGPVQVRGVPEALELRLSRGERGGMAVTERHDGDPASEVEVLATLGVPDAAPLATDDGQVGARVRGQEPLEPL